MKKSFNLIIVLFIAIFVNTNLSAEKTDIDWYFSKHNDIVVTFQSIYSDEDSNIIISLSDGSLWVMRETEENGKDLYRRISKYWKSSDEIRIATRQPEEHEGQYILKNIKNHDKLFADFHGASENSSSSYYIEDIDTNGYAIMTQDGHLWSIGYFGSFTTSKWMKGDRLLINKSDYINPQDYLLINLDQKNCAWSSKIAWEK